MSQLQVFSSSPVKSSIIIGTNVVNPKGDSLGDIKEVAIDPRTGRVAYVRPSNRGLSLTALKTNGLYARWRTERPGREGYNGSWCVVNRFMHAIRSFNPRER